MRHYFTFEIKKLIARWQFIVIVIMSVLLTGLYTGIFFDLVVQRYAVVHRIKPDLPFGLYFFNSLSGRTNLTLIISCALLSTLAWESESDQTIQRALKLTPGKVQLFILSKVLVCLTLLILQICLIWLVITLNINSFTPMLRGEFQFTQTRLIEFLFMQFTWLIPVLLLNICWYVWLGERAVVVFIFSVVSVYLLSFISFTPFYTFFQNEYGRVANHFDRFFWLFSWTIGLFFFLKKQLVNYA